MSAIAMPPPSLSQLINQHHQSQINQPHPAPIDTSSNSFSNNLSPSNPSSTNTSSFIPSTAGTSPLNYHNNNPNSAHASHHPTNSSGSIANSSNNPNSTTRILILSEFNKDLKTRDIQLVFADWEDERGGFKIKWIDDTSCLIVFADPGVAKRAFLGVLSNPPPSLSNFGPGGDGSVAKLRAYNGPDVVHVLQSVQNRPRSRSNASQSLHSRASSLASNNANNNGIANGVLGRRPSMGAIPAGRHRSSLSAATGTSRNQVAGGVGSVATVGGLSHNGPLNSSFPATPNSRPSTANSEDGGTSTPVMGSGGRARIDDAGKRFLAAGLGKSNSSINQMPIPELSDPTNSAAYSIAHLTIEEEATTPTATSH